MPRQHDANSHAAAYCQVRKRGISTGILTETAPSGKTNREFAWNSRNYPPTAVSEAVHTTPHLTTQGQTIPMR